MQRSGTTFIAIPPSIPVTLATSTKRRPESSISRAGHGTTSASPATARSTAFVPVHGRAECALTPCQTRSATRLPRQPAWIAQSVGSSMIPSSASSTGG